MSLVQTDPLNAFMETDGPAIAAKLDGPLSGHSLAVKDIFDVAGHRTVAVTGTSGKTSVADFCRQLWLFQDLKAASLGTLGLVPAREGAPIAWVAAPTVNSTLRQPLASPDRGPHRPRRSGVTLYSIGIIRTHERPYTRKH